MGKIAHSRPNFILITTDQQCAAHLGCYGNTIVRTPNIDALSKRGRRFTRFHVASGVCMANRASLMTGRYPSAHGVRCNGIPLALEAVTFVDHLRNSGYRTSLAGKCHLQNMTDLPPELPKCERVADLAKPPEDLRLAIRPDFEKSYDSEKKDNWRNDPEHAVSLPYYGFDHVDLCSYHGDLVEGQYYRWLKEKTGNADALRGPENAIPSDGLKLNQAWRTRVPEELYPTSWIADRAIEQLENAAHDQRPFFLHCSFTDPHHPFTPPGRYWDMYDPALVTLPNSAVQDVGGNLFSPVGELRSQRANGDAKVNSTVAYAATEDEIRQAIALTYGMITMIDDQVGRLMSRLQSLGLDENTIVIFTSDHGDFMGDHGLLLKSALHYSNLVRVPFIWSSANLPQSGQPTDAIWNTCDIGPSILEYAGLAPSYGVQGKSFVRAIENNDQIGHARILIEEDGHAPTFGLNHPVRARTAITDRYRLTIYDQEDWGELYDLENDPDEMRNLFNDTAAAGVRKLMFETLCRLLLEADDKLPMPTRRA